MALRLPTMHQTAAYSTIKFSHPNGYQPYAINNSLMNTSSCSTTSSASSSCSAEACEPVGVGLKHNLPFSIGSSSNSHAGGFTQAPQMQLGLVNKDGKYLTAENFGFKINATGNTLRKKQKWSIEQDNNEFVYLKSPLNFYLSADKYGKLSCEKPSPDSDCRFILESNDDGKWSFKSATHGYYFGGSNDQLHCFSKTPEWWIVHLALHPQVLRFTIFFEALKTVLKLFVLCSR
jgi:hypothetical protein